MKQCVKFYHKGDSDKSGTVLYIGTKAECAKYLAEYVYFHQSGPCPIVYTRGIGYNNRFSRFYIDKYQ